MPGSPSSRCCGSGRGGPSSWIRWTSGCVLIMVKPQRHQAESPCQPCISHWRCGDWTNAQLVAAFILYIALAVRHLGKCPTHAKWQMFILSIAAHTCCEDGHYPIPSRVSSNSNAAAQRSSSQRQEQPEQQQQQRNKPFTHRSATLE